MMNATMTLPRVSNSENAVSRQGVVLYSLRHERTGRVARHLLYTDILDAAETARYWHAAGWRVVPLTLKELPAC